MHVARRAPDRSGWIRQERPARAVGGRGRPAVRARRARPPPQRRRRPPARDRRCGRAHRAAARGHGGAREPRGFIRLVVDRAAPARRSRLAHDADRDRARRPAPDRRRRGARRDRRPDRPRAAGRAARGRVAQRAAAAARSRALPDTGARASASPICGCATARRAPLLAAGGVELDDESFAALMYRTEGWPAGLYLATLRLPAPRRTRPRRFAATTATSPTTCASSTSRTSRPIRWRSCSRRRCSTSSARRSATRCAAATTRRACSRAIEASNHFLVPLDGRPDWYRYHHLFADMLRAELERTDSGRAGRAATPCQGVVHRRRAPRGGPGLCAGG